MTVPSVRAEDPTPDPAAARRRPDLLRALFDSVDEGVCVCELVVDERGAGVDYRFLDVNGVFTTMSGIEDPVGRTVRELVENVDPGWVSRLVDVGLGRRTLRFEQESSVVGRWFDVLAVPVEPPGCFVLVFRDRTARHRDEEALRHSEERFRGLADQLPLLVLQHDATGGHDWVNAEFCRYFGVDPADLRRSSWSDVLHPDDSRSFIAQFRLSVEQRRPLHAEVRVRRVDGAWRWLESWASPQFDAEGVYVGHLVISTDITDRRAAETALRSAVAMEAYRARLLGALRTVADPVEVQARAAELLGRHLGASRVHYAEVDERLEYGVVQADYHPGFASVVGVHRFDDYGPLVMNQFRAGRLVVVADVGSDPRLTAGERAATEALGGVASYVMVPLFKQGRSVALLVVHHAAPHDWTEEELGLIEDTADLTWAAVEQARAEKALRVRHDRAQLVAELLSDLEQQSTVAAMARRLAELLVPRIADVATVEVLGHVERVSASSGAGSSGAAERAADPEPARSELTVPLELGAGGRGALTVGRSDPRRSPYTEEDRGFLEETAARVGIVLAAARLRQEEHDISVRLQQALLPDELIWHPNVLVEARYHAASELLDVGGDWYDTFAWPDGRIGVMVGDVVGHNLDSAAAMGRLRAATAALATHTEPSPAALLDALDRFARGPNGVDFATAVCVVLDPETGRLAYSSAGHPPVLVVPPGRPPVRLLGAQSLPLCSLSCEDRPEQVVTLAPGSLVVLYSDGLVERRRRSIEVGIACVEEVLARTAGEPTDVVADRLVAETSADAPPDDDIVVACFRYAPATARLRRTVPADAARLAGLRVELRAWCDAQELPVDVRNRVLLGAGEACANAVEHAYLSTADGTGSIDLELTDHGDHVTVRVRDHGRWRPTPRSGVDRGRGTMIMKAVASHFRQGSDAGGTTVTLTVPVTRAGGPGRGEPS